MSVSRFIFILILSLCLFSSPAFSQSSFKIPGFSETLAEMIESGAICEEGAEYADRYCSQVGRVAVRTERKLDRVSKQETRLAGRLEQKVGKKNIQLDRFAEVLAAAGDTCVEGVDGIDSIEQLTEAERKELKDIVKAAAPGKDVMKACRQAASAAKRYERAAAARDKVAERFASRLESFGLKKEDLLATYEGLSEEDDLCSVKDDLLGQVCGNDDNPPTFPGPIVPQPNDLTGGQNNLDYKLNA